MNEQKIFELTFLGTCACDFSPKLNTEFKDKFDKDARRSSAVLMNGAFLIDSGLHILDSLRIYGKRKSEISDIFITHLHIDHYKAENVAEIAKERKTPLRLWIMDNAEVDDIPNVTLVRMIPFIKYSLNEDMFVTGMPANHDSKVYPQHFIFERNGKKIFYGCDGGWFLNATYNHMKDQKFDLMVLDCTTGDYEGDFRMGEHNSIPMVRLMLPSLRTVKAITEKTAIYLSHLAPSLHKPHSETVEIAKKFGSDVAYDGLTITV